jgi:hypothetical protein
MPQEGFATVYDDEVWSVYGFFAYRLPSVGDAEDLTQRRQPEQDPPSDRDPNWSRTIGAYPPPLRPK